MDASGCTEYGCWDCDGALGLPVLWPYHGHWLGTSLLFFWHIFISLFKTLYGMSMWDEPLLAQISLTNASVFSKKSHQEIFSLQGLLELLSFIDFLFTWNWWWQHMVLGGLPLLALSVWQQDPAISGHIQDLDINDWGALFYSSLFGSAISYGVFFYNATRGKCSWYHPPACIIPIHSPLTQFSFLTWVNLWLHR